MTFVTNYYPVYGPHPFKKPLKSWDKDGQVAKGVIPFVWRLENTFIATSSPFG